MSQTNTSSRRLLFQVYGNGAHPPQAGRRREGERGAVGTRGARSQPRRESRQLQRNEARRVSEGERTERCFGRGDVRRGFRAAEVKAGEGSVGGGSGVRRDPAGATAGPGESQDRARPRAPRLYAAVPRPERLCGSAHTSCSAPWPLRRAFQRRGQTDVFCVSISRQSPARFAPTAHEIVASCASPLSPPKSRRRQLSPGRPLRQLTQPGVLPPRLALWTWAHCSAATGAVWSPRSGTQTLVVSVREAASKASLGRQG